MKIHIVQKGDTLWEIANQYGVDFEKVKQLNPQLSSPDMVMPGMKIKIPATSKPVKKEGEHKTISQKEKQKPDAEKPYKDTSPQPMPVIEEDDVKQPTDIKPQIPMKPKMPSMEHKMHDFPSPPKMPDDFKPEDESLEKQQMMHYQKQPPLPGIQPYHHMPPPMPHMHPVAPMQNDCGCGGPQPMPMPIHQHPIQMPMNQQPMMESMPYTQAPMQQMNQKSMPMHPGDMMKSSEPLEMPPKPMLDPGCNSYNSPGAMHPANMQQGFHYNQMPHHPHQQFSGDHMPKPPGFHENFRKEEDESSNE
ncbi:SafA/ExsA family spore coat assembly protein [Lentibacillus amyloliquefaciens]|uniref:LysM domain-containing protein n=1 Tax=Lentibacillus amyloliquefaciens TaxID=1472767 RepID=A0A0U4F5X3_9BACI|nr:SafA/ExsA family spore coat assembly protein [Lentibacillus amyloliquefaciens]ALX48195.1 hypothetical protein AOX59_05990 [Lentibacillus amyloliquefaciens]